MALSIEHVGMYTARKLQDFMAAHFTVVEGEFEEATYDQFERLVNEVAGEAYETGEERGQEDGREGGYDDGYADGLDDGKRAAEEGV